jgi:DNA polymerase-3 subunit gamma/tau
MLTAEAFNALLKMLEEPPEHVVFVLATTEKHKVLPTIISRCQSFDFRRPSIETLVAKLGRSPRPRA